MLVHTQMIIDINKPYQDIKDDTDKSWKYRWTYM